MSKYYVAFDPGIATGVAAFDEKGAVVEYNTILRGIRELDEYLDNLEKENTARMFIIEDYKVGFSYDKLKSDKFARIHGGKSIPTIEFIGNIERTARRLNAKIVRQRSVILNIAQKWSGIRVPTDHNKSHGIVAFNHGIYYLTRNNIIKPRVLKKK